MSSTPITSGSRARETFADTADIDSFVEMLGKFERGEISADAWRGFRLLRGAYHQRQDGVHMLRVKIPEGILLAEQLRALADVATRHSRGFGHITTRQNVQFHFVPVKDVEPALRRLAEAGVTTRESGGNAVRNITACPFAGVAADEAFDVTPYAEALSRYLLRHPLSSSLPRKFKIAFEGCAEDHTATPIHDMGFRAVVRQEGGERGFRVTVAGGTSSVCTSGPVLTEFLPAGEILEVAEAILRVFHRLGDRQNKQKNRMKFLVRLLGLDGWRAEVEKELAGFRAEGGAKLPFHPERPPVEEAPTAARPAPPTVAEIAARAGATALRGPGLTPVVAPLLDVSPARHDAWLRSNARAQKQPGYAAVTLTVPLGDLTADQLLIVADLSLAYADGAVRLTSSQDVVLRWVREADLRELHRRVAAAGLGAPGAHGISDVVSCPGAEACKLAVTHSRGLARLLGDHLEAHPALVAAAPDLKVHVSGCPNGCSLHHLAGVGFQGSARKLGARSAPQYFVLVGGAVRDGVATFGQLAAKVPARRVPEALSALVALYEAERQPGERATDFFARTDLARVKAVLAPLENLEATSARPEDFIDPGDDKAFRPETQEGECAA